MSSDQYSSSPTLLVVYEEGYSSCKVTFQTISKGLLGNSGDHYDNYYNYHYY